METEPAPLIDHLESNFGRIEAGWNGQDPLADKAIQIAEFHEGKVPGVTVISTLGMSSFPLQSAVSNKQIRQELFIMVRTGQLDSRLPAILDQVARESVRTDTPILRGQVVRKRNAVLEEKGFVAFYATLPVYYPADFWTLRVEDLGDVVFCWLLPLKQEEELHIGRNGWSGFEKLLGEAKLDLFDLNRPSLC